MKQKLIVLLMAFLSIFAMVGCQEEDKALLIAGSIKIGARIAASEVMRSQPETHTVFTTVANSIDNAIAGSNFAPDFVNDLIKKEVKKLNISPSNKLLALDALELALATYGRYYSVNIKDKIAAAPAFKEALVSLSKGIKTAVEFKDLVEVDGPAENPLLSLSDEDLKL